MPSLREGCPNALLEALAFSRPVVASKIAGISDIIKDGEDGLLVDTSDPNKFADKIIYLCKNPTQAILMGERGRIKVRVEFTFEKEAQEFSLLYHGIYKD
jgi:glycosyltransferase involved in cell wall biosynthesis